MTVFSFSEPAHHDLQFLAEVGMANALLDGDGVNEMGLQLLRLKLRHQDTAERVAAMGTNPAEARRLLLDRVSRLIAGDDQGKLAVYAGMGDLITGAPDDISELDE